MNFEPLHGHDLVDKLNEVGIDIEHSVGGYMGIYGLLWLCVKRNIELEKRVQELENHASDRS